MLVQDIGALCVETMGLPRASTKPGVISLVADLDIRVVATQTGELLRHLTQHATTNPNPNPWVHKVPMSRDIKILSGRRDLNPRPPRPERGALPSCATARVAEA